MQNIGVFNVNVLFPFLNVYSLDNNNDLQHLHHESWHFLTLKFCFTQQFLWFSCCRLLFLILMLSNPVTLFLLRTSTKFLIGLYTGGLFGLTLEIKRHKFSKINWPSFSSSLLMQIVAYLGANIVPIAVPFVCTTNSKLNLQLLFSRISLADSNISCLLNLS